MTTSTMHPTAAAYIKRLRQAARPLPRAPRQELIDDIEAHLREATSADSSEADVLATLDRLGEPEEIVAAQLPSGVNRAKGVHEWSAIILLLIGGFFFGIGWVVGLILLWSSRAWSTVDKLIGTLVLPGGLSAVLFVLILGGSVETCVSGPGQRSLCTGGPGTAHQILAIALLAIVLLAPCATAVYLARRARPPTSSEY